MALTKADQRRRYRTSDKGRAENRARMQRRRAQIRACGSKAGDVLRRQVNWLGWALCRGCGRIHSATCIEVDHVWPVWLGGCDTPDNVQFLCLSCHRTKSAIEAAWR